MKQTAVEWLVKEIKNEDHHTEGELGNSCIDVNTLLMLCEQAKEMESDREYEIKAFWFGRGINAGRENKIEELKPKKD